MKIKTFERSSLSTAIKTILIGSGAALAISAGAPVQAGEVDDVKQEVQQLLERIDQLEAEQASAAGESVTASAEESTSLVMKNDPYETGVVRNRSHQDFTPEGVDPIDFKLGGTDTIVTVSGYVKLDAIYDVDQDVGDSFVFSSIAPDGTAAADSGPHTRFHARQSRLRVKSSTPVGDKEIKTHIEADFFGNGGNETFSNSTSLRIRHAYVSYGGWLFGQYWSNFQENDFVAYPGTVDFFGPVGQSFMRQAQIRYTWENGFSVSAENPETTGTGSLGSLRESTGGVGSDELPDFTVAWRGGSAGAGGAYEFSAVFRELGVKADTTGDGNNDIDETESGTGFMAAGGWNIGDSTYLYAHYNFGDGIGRYIINGFQNDLFVDANGNVDTVESSGGNIGVTFDVGDMDKINFVYGFFENEDPAESNGIDELTSFHASYWNHRQAGLSLGYEVIFGEAEYSDGSEGDNTRLQFAVQKSF